MNLNQGKLACLAAIMTLPTNFAVAQQRQPTDAEMHLLDKSFTGREPKWQKVTGVEGTSYLIDLNSIEPKPAGYTAIISVFDFDPSRPPPYVAMRAAGYLRDVLFFCDGRMAIVDDTLVLSLRPLSVGAKLESIACPNKR